MIYKSDITIFKLFFFAIFFHLDFSKFLFKNKKILKTKNNAKQLKQQQ